MAGDLQNPAWQNDRAGFFVRIFALLGRLALLLFCPQARVGRLAFAAGLAGWCAAGWAGYALMDPIADAEWISDAAIVRIAALYGWAATLWNVGVTVLAARRAHDWGVSGAWALLLSAPGLNLLFLAACLLLPGRPEGRIWPEAGAL